MNGQGEFYLGILLFFCFTPSLHCKDMILDQFESIGQWLKLTDQNLMGCTVLSLGSKYVYFLSICIPVCTSIFISHYCFYRYPDIDSFPSVKMSESFNPAIFPNKCYFAVMKIIAADPDLGRKTEILKTVSIKPLAAFFDLDKLDDAEKIPSLSFPTFLVVAGKPLIHVRCTGDKKFFLMASVQMLHSTISDFCKIQGQTVHVAFNNVSPYFQISESGDPVPRQLEFIYLDTFLRQHRAVLSQII